MTTDTEATLAAPVKFRTEEATYLPLNLIQASAHNPRKRFDQAKLEQLADSIEAKGVQQAIVVRKHKAPTLSPEAAWPFPTTPQAKGSEAPPQSVTTEKPAKARKAKPAAKTEEASL